MTANGNIIGKVNTPAQSAAGGVYDTLDQYTAKRINTWPITIKYSSITVNSSTSALSLNEGSSITVVVATEGITSGTLYYSISSVGGTVNTSDFTDSVMTGSFTISSNTGTFTKTLTADGTSEAGDAFQVEIRTGSTSGPIVLTSSTITINNPVFTVSMGAATYNEGASPYINFSATNWNTQTLYWRSSNAADDNTGGLTQNTFSYTSGVTSTFNPYTLKNDMITEGNETHTISIYNTNNTVLLASTTYTAVDTSLTPTVTESSLSINEGDSVTFTVTFPGGPTSGTIYWTTTGTMTANDFTDGVLSGTASISASGSNGVATITRTARRDYITDGAKSFGLNLYRDGVATTLVYTGSSTRISVADTVQAPTITASATSINEGDPVTFTLTTTGVPDGTVFPYSMITTVGSYGGPYDFTDSLTSGNLTVTGNTASVTKTWANDTYTDGTQSYTLTIRPPVGSLLSTTILATSPTIVVADTSSGTAVPALYGPFNDFTFNTTNLRTTIGPTLAQCQTEYNTSTYPWLTNTAYFNVTGGIQIWTIPATGNYRITAKGAGGAPWSGSSNSTNSVGGSGATMQGTFALMMGDKLSIAVGQMGISGDSYAGGGGGGSWVVKYGGTTVNDILVIAGGGGGIGYSSGATGKGASSTTTATTDGGNGGVAATGGNGGAGGTSSYSGGGGGGFLTDGGASGSSATAGGKSWLNGLVGGTAVSGNLNSTIPTGGFGGGGCGNVQGGGGGGYSGGVLGSGYYSGGGGGASYMGINASSATLTNGTNGIVSSVNFASYYGTVLIEKI